jgi:L-erythro-3,5-diaminohexanoate dehydrogenase
MNRYEVLRKHLFPLENKSLVQVQPSQTSALDTNSPLIAYGAHRVVEPRDALPQAAIKVDNTPKLLHNTELLLEVDFLLPDSTSMRQIRESCGGDQEKMGRRIEEIINKHGKMHNPITFSGGVLKGRVKAVGSEFEKANNLAVGSLQVGQPIIPVVSLSTIPLHAGRVTRIEGNCVFMEGSTAIIFSCMPITIVPEDITEKCALACVDISSLVPQVKRTLIQVVEDKIKKGCRDVPVVVNVLVVAVGNAGLAGIYALRQIERYFRTMRNINVRLNIIAVDNNKKQVEWVRELEHGTLVDHIAHVNALKPYDMHRFVHEKTNGQLADFSINVVNINGTEAPTLLCTKARGVVIWFSMATRFDGAALSTDVLGKDVTMIVGNGIAEGQVDDSFELVRAHPPLRYLMEHGH